MSKIKIEKLSAEQRQELRIPDSAMQQGDWSVWQCAPSTFDWHYDQEEHAYVYAGKVTVTTTEDEVVIHAGDYVVFPAGLDCRWQVAEKIVKVYKFV